MRDDQREFLQYALRGNVPAVEFCELLGQITQVWDDIIDGDNPELTHEDINAAFWNLFIALPNNVFYQQNFHTLSPLLQAAIVDWWDSNELVKGGVTEKAAAYVLRDTLTTIVIHCARIIGGYAWMREVSMEVRKFLYTEDLLEFMEEHSGEHRRE
jgi:hypothetical protein